ncbi:MAG TPA: bacteriohopanetetrol glucosamine biosynthesis glycosyltransferase HpnI [Bryobacteraceae bacterium]|nr:bacteriohopanetetrol glucosamine biosynthesis glycosyltransferase HpnI [Bryobacteraceae bacterium]
MAAAAAWVLLALLAGSLVYCVLVVIAALKYARVPPAAASSDPPISILKPLAGADEGLEENLRSFFTQAYPSYEVLCAVRHDTDPAVAVVRRLQLAFPHIPSRLIITGEPPYANAKVYSLHKMLEAARHDILVMSDSDIRVGRGMLQTVSAEFVDPRLGVATCPYRAVAGGSVWSRLEAIGMNTEFIAGVLVARMLEGMKFAVGPTIVARRQTLQAIGGFDRLAGYLAEDFVMGGLAVEAGWKVILSSYVVEHRIGSEPVSANMAHRLRWARSTRRSRPAGYIGQLFTFTWPLAIALLLLQPGWILLFLGAVLFRLAAALATSGGILNAPDKGRIDLLLLQDLLSFSFWIAGFFGNTILWRGRKYYLKPDGTFELVR